METIKTIIANIRANREKNMLDSKQEYGTYNDGFFEALKLIEDSATSSAPEVKAPANKKTTKKVEDKEPEDNASSATRADAIFAIFEEETDKNSELAVACQNFMTAHTEYHLLPSPELLEKLLELEKVALSLASQK